jgi:hypothetical protein
MPATIPVVAFTVPSDVLLLLHVPPDAVLLNVVVPLTQTDAIPVIAGIEAFTVTIVTALQPPAIA